MKIYDYMGWRFTHYDNTYWPLTVDGKPRKRAGGKFYWMLDRFKRLSEAERVEFEVKPCKK